MKKTLKNIRKLGAKVLQFFKDAFAELKAVEWLSRRETFKYSSLILLFIVVGALYTAFLDWAIFKVLMFIIEI